MPVIKLGDFVPPRLRSLAALVEWLKLVTTWTGGPPILIMHFHPAATDGTRTAQSHQQGSHSSSVWAAVVRHQPVPSGPPILTEAGCGSQPLRGNSRSRKLTATRSGAASGRQRDSKVPTTRPGSVIPKFPPHVLALRKLPAIAAPFAPWIWPFMLVSSTGKAALMARTTGVKPTSAWPSPGGLFMSS